MMFFGKNKSASDAPAGTSEPKKRSTFGILFNPQIGESIKPLAETTGVFVQLIAMVFAMNGLFPKNHPALTGELTADGKAAKLSLSEIIGTAWRDLSFTKAGAPKVALFFAVTGTLVLAVISIITALLAGFMGTAHAQTAAGSGGFFTPVDSTNDLAQNWIDYLFNGKPLSSYYQLPSGDQNLGSSNGLQCALITALGFYSNGMLIFASFILAYHLVVMIVSTAHEGVAMGKKERQVWAPIRLVVAIGLLIPMGTSSGSQCSTSTGAGLNAGQYIVIQMAEWGSGLASQVWNVFLTSLAKQYNYIAPSPQNVEKIVGDMAIIEACRYAYNFQIWSGNNAASGGTSGNPAVSDQYIGGSLFDPNSFSKVTQLPRMSAISETKWLYSGGTPETDGICGSYTLQNPSPPPTGGATSMGQTAANAIVNAYNQAFTNELSEFATLGSNISYYIEGNQNYGGTIPSNTALQTEVTNFQNSMKQALDNEVSNMQDNSLASQVQQWAGYGWATAGAWLNTIAGIQGSLFVAGADSAPVTTPPDINSLPSNIAYEVASFGVWATSGNPYSPTAPAAPTALSDPCGGAETVATQGMQSNQADNNTLHKYLTYINTRAKDTKLWNFDNNTCATNGQPGFALGAQLQTANPFAEIAAFGHKCVNIAYGMMVDDPELTDLNGHPISGGFTESSKYITKERSNYEQSRFSTHPPLKDIATGLYNLQLLSWHLSIETMIAMMFFTCGFTLAFVVPLLPFFRFFFNVLTWIVSLLEAVVAVPLIALAHLNPEGEGLPGQSAKAGYFLIFNIFLRPVMTVFGLIAGLLVFIIAIIFLNATYGLAVAGTGAMFHGYAVFARIVYTLIYGATVYSCANNCFRPIGAFPEHALRWIGQTAHHEKMGDGGNAVRAVMGQAQTYAGQKAIDISKVTQGQGGGL